MSEECQELKNIKYKSMLLNGLDNKVASNTRTANVNLFLDQERSLNKMEPWNKLDKTVKIKQLHDYVELIALEHALDADASLHLKNYLAASLDRKKLQCVKDVQYDNGKIKLIPSLQFNPLTRKFTLKRSDKRSSTLKSLGLGSANTDSKLALKKTAVTTGVIKRLVLPKLPVIVASEKNKEEKEEKEEISTIPKTIRNRNRKKLPIVPAIASDIS